MTKWKPFPAQALYDYDDGGYSDLMLGQGSCSYLRALDDCSIVGRCAFDRRLHEFV